MKSFSRFSSDVKRLEALTERMAKALAEMIVALKRVQPHANAYTGLPNVRDESTYSILTIGKDAKAVRERKRAGVSGVHATDAHASGIVPQSPPPCEQSCVVCLQHFEGYGFFNWCSTCTQAWETSGTVFERFHGTDDHKRRASIRNSWVATRRKEVQREREVTKGCP